MNRKFTWDKHGDQITIAEALDRAEVPEYHKPLPGKEKLVYGEYSDGVAAFDERMEYADTVDTDEVVEWVEVDNDTTDFHGSENISFEDQFESMIEATDVSDMNLNINQEQLDSFIATASSEELQELRDVVASSDEGFDGGDQKVLTR